MNHDNHGLDLVQTGLYSNCHALCSVCGCYLELCDFWTLVKPSLLLSVSLFSFVYMYHLSYSGTKMISIRFYGHRPSHRGGTVRSFFHDLIVYKGHCTHWKTVKQLWLSSLRKKFPNKKKMSTLHICTFYKQL